MAEIPNIIIVGDESEFNSHNSFSIHSDTLTATKFVVTYSDGNDSNIGKAIIGEISGTNIIFGDATAFDSTLGTHCDNGALSESGFVASIFKDSNYHVQVGVISGVDITLGDSALWHSGSMQDANIVVLSPTKFVISYQDFVDSKHGKSIVGTISGTTVTFGNKFEFLNTGTASYMTSAAISESGFVVAYWDGSDSWRGKAKVGTVSGTTITFGDAEVFTEHYPNSPDGTAMAMLSATKIVVAYSDAEDEFKGKLVVGAVSGTDILFGTIKALTGASTPYVDITTVDSNTFAVLYRNGIDGNRGAAKIGSVNGTDILVGEATEALNDGYIYNPQIILVDDELVMSYRDGGDSYHGTSKLGLIGAASSCSLYLEGYSATQASGDLVIVGSQAANSSGNLYINGYEAVQESTDLFMKAYIPKSDNFSLYMDGIKVSTTIYACGDNRNRSLGVIAPVNRVTSLQRAFGTLFVRYPFEDYPHVVANEEEHDATHRTPTTAACRPTQGVCVDENDHVWSVGTNTSYALGIGITDESHAELLPVRVSGLPDIPFSTVRIGDRISFAMAENGTVWGWGHNTHGELGIGNSINQEIAQQVSGITNAIDIAANDHHVAFLTSSGVYACGDYTNGKLGIDGVASDVLIPQKVSGLNSIEIIQVSCGDDTTMFLSSSGDIYFCGENNHGLFGNGTAKGTIWNTPALSISGSLYGIPPYISCNTNSSAFLDGSGKIHCAGYNWKGQFGNGVTTGDYIDYILVGTELPSGCEIHAGTSATWFCATSSSGAYAAGGTFYGEVGSVDGIPWTSWQSIPDSPGQSRILGNDSQFILYRTVTERILQHSNSCNLYITAPSGSQASGNFYINGHDVSQTSGDMFLHGYDTIPTSGDLFALGHNPVSASGDLCIISFVEINVSGDLFVSGSGIIDASGNSSFFINGYEPKPALACPILDPTASIQISDTLIGIYQSRIDALINQLGKNVYLEFDPIRDPCPNCEYDTIRKRSTGIYITGGPRPFKRGRRCPYCKGRGFTETPVNKCIKCLLKWNPDDAANFGIAVSQTKGIVRLKTYLTEADDLARAKTILSNHDIADQMKLRAKLIRGPIPVGLREDRYCISFWELI